MGSWGVTAHESDYGLDLLGVARDRYLAANGFECFGVKAVTELLKAHIIDSFRKESEGWPQYYIDYFYEYTFPEHFAHAVMLIAECFAEYRKNGELSIYDYKADKERQVTKFVFTRGDLESLREELQKVISPEHPMYEGWEDSDSMSEWLAHMEALSGVLAEAIAEGGESRE